MSVENDSHTAIGRIAHGVAAGDDPPEMDDDHPAAEPGIDLDLHEVIVEGTA